MTTPGATKEKQDHGTDTWISEPVRKNLSEVDEEVKALAEEDSSGTATTGMADRSLMPEIKGVELLKAGVHSVDLDKTVADMFATIRNMEAQLERVIRINTHLEKDLKASREMISVLKSDKAQLEQAVARMEQEIPAKRELQNEIDQLIEERNAAQGIIREMKLKIESAQKSIVQLQNRAASLGEEKKNSIKEINFLEYRLGAAIEKMRKYESEINILKGEKLVQMEKIKP